MSGMSEKPNDSSQKEETKGSSASMIMKYAEAEKRCIDLQKTVSILQSKLNEHLKEKLKTANQVSELDKKLQEIATMKKDNDKLREQCVLVEAREQAAQLRLRNEQEAHAALKKQHDGCLNELTNLKNKILFYEQEAQNWNIKNSANVEVKGEELDISTKELEIEETRKDSPDGQEESKKSSTCDSSTVTSSNAEQFKKKLYEVRELAALKSQLKDMFEERATLREKVQLMEHERKQQDTSLNKYKETLQAQKNMNKDLLTEILQLRDLKETVLKERNEKNELIKQVTHLSDDLTNIKNEFSLNDKKQSELLVYTSKLTAKITELQAENYVLIEKSNESSTKLENMKSLASDSENKIKKEKDSFNEVISNQTSQIKALQSALDEATRKLEEVNIKLADQFAENTILKKKHAANIKDLVRQLKVLQNNTQSMSPITYSNGGTIDSTFVDSKSFINDDWLSKLENTRARSNSLASLEKESLQNISSKMSSTNADFRTGESIATGEISMAVDFDKQKMVEKIVKLQKNLAKKSEKIEIFQEQINNLLQDVKRKTKIIQAYAMVKEVGTFEDNMIKPELSKSNAMAKVYKNNQISLMNLDETSLTKDFCLEINIKLQALLEETMLKNITLKENLETLGHEISRLSNENQQLKFEQI